MSDDNEWVSMNVEKNDGKKPWIATSSPQRMIHKGRTVIYQQLKYRGDGGVYRGYVVIPGYATSAPFKKEYKGKTVTTFMFERINDYNDRIEIEKCLNEENTTMPLEGTINIAPRERTPEEKVQDAKNSEKLRKKAKVAEENLLNLMRTNPNARKFVEGFAKYLHRENNRMQI